MLSAIANGNPDGLACHRIGAPLLFGRLWQDTGIQAVLGELLAQRGFEFPLERAVFTATLHRLMASGSDRACGFGRGSKPHMLQVACPREDKRCFVPSIGTGHRYR